MAAKKDGKKPPANNRRSKATDTTPEYIDPFAALFGDFDSDQDYVVLHRLEPKEFQDVMIAGYLEKVLPGVDEQYIKDRFGGGKYMLQKKDQTSHRIVTTRTLDIAGLPKVSLAASSGQPGSPGADPFTFDIGGLSVPFSGDLDEMKKMMFFVKALKSAFPEPPNVNDTLLKLLLDKPAQPNILETASQLKELTGLFGGGDSGGGGNASDGLYGLLNTAVQQAGGVIKTIMTPNLARMAGGGTGRLPGTGPAIGPVKTTGVNEQITDIRPSQDAPENDQQQEENREMGQQNMLLAVASTFVKCWRLSPPKEVNRVVALVDMIVQQSDATVRQQIKEQFAETMLDIAETELVEDWSDPDTTVGSRADFVEYCGKIFDEYVRPDRTVVV